MIEAQHGGPSWMRILGFACHQGCIFSLFYMGANQGLSLGGIVFERVDLFLVLAFMCLAFALSKTHIARSLESSASTPTVLASAAMLVVGTIAPQFPLSSHAIGLVIEGLLVGYPLAELFLAWSIVLGSGSPRTIACEVFAATGFASAICFACAFMPSMAQAAIPVFCAVVGSLIVAFCLMERKRTNMPQGTASAFEEIPSHRESSQTRGVSAKTKAPDMITGNAPDDARALPRLSLSSVFKKAGIGAMSTRMIAGAVTFGIAAGFMESYRSDPGMLSTPDFPATLLILALFCIAVLQSLFVEKPTEGESLGSMYRIAMLVIMAGFLFAPLLQRSGVPGEAIILAGYLGLAASFMSFFLVMARVAHAQPALTFAGGLLALYAGEALGIAAANAYDTAMPNVDLSYGIMACAGLAILFAYLFLFTERDFRTLSEIVDTSDEQERACARLVKRCGLSAREAEVLALALKGRSNERIAQELYVAKSTADTHMRRIYAKCGVKGRQELIDLGERTIEELRGAKTRP